MCNDNAIAQECDNTSLNKSFGITTNEQTNSNKEDKKQKTNIFNFPIRKLMLVAAEVK